MATEEQETQTNVNQEERSDKYCFGCHRILPLNDFTPAKTGRQGRCHRCKQCIRASRRDYHREYMRRKRAEEKAKKEAENNDNNEVQVTN